MCSNCLIHEAIYPLDVVRRQMQTIGMKSGHGNVHTKVWPALREIVKKVDHYFPEK